MSNILSSVEGGIIGVGVGEAAAAAVEPSVEPAKQEVWQANPFRVLEPELLAQLVAQALTTFDAAAAQAKRSGYDGNPFRAMVEAMFRVPGTAEALELWRRGRIDKEQVRHALHKAQLEPQYIEPVLELVGERLSPEVIANAVQQGFLDNPGLLPKPTPPQPDWTAGDGPFDIPTERVQLTDEQGNPTGPVREAEASGYSFERLQVEAELSGNPPGEETLLDLWRRGIIGPAGYETGLREGRTKTKWTAALSARFYALLPPSVLVNLRLRGWIDDATYHARMARHGYRDGQADDWFKSSGRPATTHQALVGHRRGGVYDGDPNVAEPYFRHAVEQSNIHPRWTNLLWAGRETIPSAFVMRRLVQDGALTAAEAADYLYKAGWIQELAHKATAAWANGTETTTDPHVTRAETQLWTRTHAAFVAFDVDEQTVRAQLDTLGVPADAQDRILALWTSERELPRKQLTRTDIRKQYREATLTRELAVEQMMQLGYTEAAANSYLDE